MDTTLQTENSEFDLGRWLGRREAFSMLAGRCSAAEVESLKRIRDGQLYKSRSANWNEFCTQYVGTSKTQANRLIGYLEEFGPAYFHLSQFTRVSPDTFRAIASNLSEEGVRWGGEVIALLPENSRKVADAVAGLRRQAAAPPAAKVPALERLEKRCQEVVELLAEMRETSKAERCVAAQSLAGILLEASRIGIQLDAPRRR